MENFVFETIDIGDTIWISSSIKDSELYASQLGVRHETNSVTNARCIIKAFDGYEKISLASLKEFEGRTFGLELFTEPQVAIFKRIRSDGKLVDAILVLEGHHRIGAAKLAGIQLEVRVASKCETPIFLRGYEQISQLQSQNKFPNSVEYLVGFNKIIQGFRRSFLHSSEF